MVSFVGFLKTNAVLLAIPYMIMVIWLVSVAQKAKSVFVSEMSYLPTEIRNYRGWKLNKDQTEIALSHRSLARLILWGKPPEIELAPLPEEELIKFRLAYAVIFLPAPIISALFASKLSIMHIIAIISVGLILIWRPWPWGTPPS